MFYYRGEGHLALDIDFIDDYINHHTPENPDDWEVDEDCVDEIQHFRNLAERKQEEDEIRWEQAVNNPDHPDHAREMAKLNETTVWIIEFWDDEGRDIIVANSEADAKRYLLDVIFNGDYATLEEAEENFPHSFKVFPTKHVGKS